MTLTDNVIDVQIAALTAREIVENEPIFRALTCNSKHSDMNLLLDTLLDGDGHAPIITAVAARHAHDGHLVGWAVCELYGNEKLLNVFVSPICRRRGVGRRLVAAVFATRLIDDSTVKVSDSPAFWRALTAIYPQISVD